MTLDPAAAVGMLTELVTQRTVSGDPKPQRSAMDAVVSVLNARTAAITVDGDRDGPHPWLLITNDAHPKAQRLMFACHVDTVPAGDLSNWQFDPFAADVENGVLRGRGTSDMKAGLVAATAAVLDAFEGGVPAARSALLRRGTPSPSARWARSWYPKQQATEYTWGIAVRCGSISPPKALLHMAVHPSAAKVPS